MTDLTQYIKVECVINDIKTVKDLDKAYFVFWKFRCKVPFYSDATKLFYKDRLREKLLGKMREVL